MRLAQFCSIMPNMWMHKFNSCLEVLFRTKNPVTEKHFLFHNWKLCESCSIEPMPVHSANLLELSVPKLGIYIYCDLAVSGLHKSKVRMSDTMALMVPWGKNTPVKLC